MLALLLLVPLLAPAQGRREQDAEDFRRQREHVLIYAGQRHLVYGVELRDKGLTTQAAAQIVLAVEASEGLNPGAGSVLALMRQLDGAFWKRKLEKPSATKLEAYDKKARKLRVEDQSERLELVRWAEKRNLDQEAWAELHALLLAIDEPLEFDAKGALTLAGGTFAGPLAERVRDAAIQINGRPYARDAFLEKLPELAEVFEAGTPALRVRTTTSVAEAERLLAVGGQLLPLLALELGAAPDRRLQLVLLGERATYEAYLDAIGQPAHKSAEGFADRRTSTAVMTGHEDEEQRTAVALHELTHLFQLGVSPAVFPSWYMEGFAETFGGEGTFLWNGATLSACGMMAPRRLEDLRAGLLPVHELLAGDALTLLGRDRQLASRFYAQSWAFLRFLEDGAGDDARARLERWRAMCLGSAIGADLALPYRRDAAGSRQLFLELFEPDLERLEREFVAWLERL